MASPGATAAQDRRPLPAGFHGRLLRHLAVEIGPLLLFFLTFLWRGLLWATAVYALATVAAFAVTWAKHRRLPVLPGVTALLVLTFAGLTLVLDDSTFIKIKPTVVNGFFGIALLGGWLLGFRLVERVLGSELSLSETGLRLLTLRAGTYLLGLALANEIVWRSLPTEQWVLFKVFVIVGCNLTFAWTQLPLVRRHLRRG
ncbi:MAG: inner membrane-spanning protein YciB [Tistlia sp.]|uniref:inner membrane-spanning protein YciB n=1 Tax=Tistlia sp. TaxID=3057121 RepID=UPI0034A2C588